MALPEDRRDDLELFLGAAAGDGAALPDPQTRVERYLAHIADPTVDKPDHPETRIELFLDAIEPGPGPSPILPEDYQQVEYIQTDGASYINTMIVPRSTTGINMEISVHNATPGSFHSGMRQDSGNSRFTIGYNSGLLTVGYTEIQELGDTSLREITTDVPFTCSINFMNDKKIKFNDTELANISSVVFPNSYTKPIFLLSANTTASPSPHSGDRVYSAEITSDAKLIFNGIPCYEKDNIASIGLYDTVSKIFFVNAGTGSLMKGPDVVSGDELLNELEAIL